MHQPQLTQDEHDLLKALAEKEPLPGVPNHLSGRLSLYKLVAETPEGWVLTPAGKDALNVPTLPTPAKSAAPTVRRCFSGATRSPFAFGAKSGLLDLEAGAMRAGADRTSHSRNGPAAELFEPTFRHDMTWLGFEDPICHRRRFRRRGRRA